MSINTVALRPGFSLRRPSVRAAAEDPVSSLEHIFVIAGPSGSGKSTFMREFVEDRLPRNIADDLPAEAKTWSRTSGNELSRKGLLQVLRAKRRTRGLVLHYDIMRAYSRGYENHANDPAMQAVTGVKVRLTVMTILPSREALFEQFLNRGRFGDCLYLCAESPARSAEHDGREFLSTVRTGFRRPPSFRFSYLGQRPGRSASFDCLCHLPDRAAIPDPWAHGANDDHKGSADASEVITMPGNRKRRRRGGKRLRHVRQFLLAQSGVLRNRSRLVRSE